jgi:hypothetical protein
LSIDIGASAAFVSILGIVIDWREHHQFKPRDRGILEEDLPISLDGFVFLFEGCMISMPGDERVS